MRSDSFQRDEGRSTPTLLNTSTEEELLVYKKPAPKK